MKIFQTSTDSQEFILTPRYLADHYVLRIYNEDTREEVSYYTNTGALPPTAKIVTATPLNEVSLTLTFNYTVTSNQTFRLIIHDFDGITNDIVLWRGKAFATSQDTQKYKINV